MLYVVPSYLCTAPPPPPPSPSVGLAGSQRRCSLSIVLEPDNSLMQLSINKTKVTIQFTWYWSKFSFLYITLFPELTGVCPSLTSRPVQGCAGWFYTAEVPKPLLSPAVSGSWYSAWLCLPWATVRLTEVLAESCHCTAQDATSSLVLLWTARDVRSYCSVSSSSCLTFLLSL